MTGSEWVPVARRALFASRSTWCAAMLGWACAAPIHAAEFGYGLGLSLAHESNIKRVETNPESELTQALIFGLFLRENNEDVTARVLAQVERRRFYRHTFGDDMGGFLDGAAVWTILPRQFTWFVQDVFREVQLNIAAPSIPSNLTKSNALTTGPNLTFPLSSTNSAVIGGRYGRFDIQNSNADNRRYTVYARGLHALSAQTKLSLNYEATRTHFEPGAQVFPKVLREDWFAGYENRSTTNSTTIEIGTSRVTQYGGPAPEGSRLARLTFSEALSSQSRLRLALSYQVSDTYTDQIGGGTSSTAPRETGVVVLNGTTSATGDLYHSKRGGLVYENNDGRFRYALQGFAHRVDFETLDEDYLEKSGAFLWTWLYSGAMAFNSSTTYIKRTFSPVDPASLLAGRQDTDRTYVVSAAYRPNGNATVTMEFGRFLRQSTVTPNSFVDNRVMLVLGYSSGFADIRSRR